MPTRATLTPVALVLFAPTLARPLGAQSVERHVLRGRDVSVYDPAGRVQVVRGSGSDVVVELTRGGRDGGRLRVLTDDVDGRPSLRVVSPDRELRYPELGFWSSTTLAVRRDGTFGEGNGDDDRGDGDDRLTIRGRGDGPEAWADLVVRVPTGAHLTLRLGAGAATARDVDGDLSLGTNVAAVTTEHTRGRLTVGAGSGHVQVRDAQGDEVRIGTGSGGGEVRGVRAERLQIGAGSGGLRGGDLDVRDAKLGTGSGGLHFDNVRVRSLRMGSGSGGAELELTGPVETAQLSTGSGGITLRLARSVGATLDVRTGSGGVSTDLPVQVSRQERNYFVGQVGDGSGHIQISSGSGTVRLEPAR